MDASGGPDSVQLRPAATDDVDAIAELWHLGWGDGHRGHVPEALIAHRSFEQFRRRVPGRLPSTTVAMMDGRIVGFVMAIVDEIEQIYVARDARGTGTAEALLRHGERVIGTHHEIAWLAVVEGNARARAFYERLGWSDAGAIDYQAEADGGTMTVPSRRYEKVLVPNG